MSDSTATTLATAGVRAVAGPTSDLTLQVKKGTETSAAANVQVPATLLTQEPANPGEIPAPDAHFPANSWQGMRRWEPWE